MANQVDRLIKSTLLPIILKTIDYVYYTKSYHSSESTCEDNSIYDFVSIGNELHSIRSEEKLPSYNYPKDMIMDRKDEDSNTKDITGLTIDHLSSSGWGNITFLLYKQKR